MCSDLVVSGDNERVEFVTILCAFVCAFEWCVRRKKLPVASGLFVGSIAGGDIETYNTDSEILFLQPVTYSFRKKNMNEGVYKTNEPVDEKE